MVRKSIKECHHNSASGVTRSGRAIPGASLVAEALYSASLPAARDSAEAQGSSAPVPLPENVRPSVRRDGIKTGGCRVPGAGWFRYSSGSPQRGPARLEATRNWRSDPSPPAGPAMRPSACASEVRQPASTAATPVLAAALVVKGVGYRPAHRVPHHRLPVAHPSTFHSKIPVTNALAEGIDVVPGERADDLTPRGT